MRPWLVVAIGLGLAVAAGWAWLASEPVGGARSASQAPSGEIRDDSREAMRQLLRQADGAEGEKR